MTATRRRGHLTLIVSPPSAADAADAAGGAATGDTRPAFTVAAAAEPAAAETAAARATATPTAPAPDTDGLPAAAATLVRLVAGAPLATPACDLVDFANSAWAGLDPARDPNGYGLAEVTLAWFHTHVAVERRTQGERAGDLASDFQRYLLPYALDFDADRPHDGVSRLRLQHAKRFVTMISGAAALPAATVAADLLGAGRTGLSCTWLTLTDAAAVCDGGTPALAEAIARGAITPATADGVQLVRPAALRAANLLIEPDEPHGLAASTQKDMLKTLRSVIDHAVNLGADVRGKFDTVKPIEPLPHQRLRPASEPRRFVPLTEVGAVCRHLAPVFQLAIWLMALLGTRIGETYGLDVADVTERGGRMWLSITTQGGKTSLLRDEDGTLRRGRRKPSTKTRKNRTVPVPAPLANLIRETIRVFHTDPTTGEVDTTARLIPGIATDHDGGITALYSALAAAFTTLRAENPAVVRFNPHDLRYSVITALENAGVEDRLGRWYVGHTSPKDVHEAYDLGPQGDELVPVAETLTRLAAEQIDADLRIPTTRTAQWGAGTRRAATAHLLRAELLATGWLRPLPKVTPPGLPAGEDRPADAPVSAAELAREAGLAPQTVRKLLRTGQIPGAHQRSWGDRPVWYTYRSDADAWLARQAATVESLAERIGYTYHQTWTLLVQLRAVDPQRKKGAAIRLTDADVTAVLDELARRERAASELMLLDEAEQRLQLPRLTVETLLRRGELTQAPAPDGTRHRYVTVASVEAYLAAFPATPQQGADDLVVPVLAARRALRVTRPAMTHLVASRQVIARAVHRRQCITLASALRRLEAFPVPGARERLLAAAFAPPRP